MTSKCGNTNTCIQLNCFLCNFFSKCLRNDVTNHSKLSSIFSIINCERSCHLNCQAQKIAFSFFSLVFRNNDLNFSLNTYQLIINYVSGEDLNQKGFDHRYLFYCLHFFTISSNLIKFYETHTVIYVFKRLINHFHNCDNATPDS